MRFTEEEEVVEENWDWELDFNGEIVGNTGLLLLSLTGRAFNRDDDNLERIVEPAIKASSFFLFFLLEYGSLNCYYRGV